MLACACAIGLSGCAGGSDPADTTVAFETTTSAAQEVETVRISVVVGTNSDSERVEMVALGSSVEVTLANPGAADNFHLHGYDLETGEVAAGQEATISFTADTVGSFEIESHVTEDVLLTIKVG